MTTFFISYRVLVTIIVALVGTCIALFSLPLAAEAAVSRTGSVLNFSNTSNASNQSITVPADAELMVISASGYTSVGANYYSSGTVTLGGNAFSIAVDADNDSGAQQHVLYYRDVRALTGSQTLAWDWLGSSGNLCGANFHYAFYKGVDFSASPLRASGGGQNFVTFTTGSLTAQTGDMIAAVLTATDNTTASFTNVTQVRADTFSCNRTYYAEGTPTGNTTVGATLLTGDGDGGLSGIVIKAAPAAARAALSKPPNNLGLVGYWSFNDATSTIATDFSGREKSGTLSGSTRPSWVAGNRGKALDFEGTAAYVAVGSLGSNIQSVSFWIKADTTASKKIMDLDGGTHVIELNSSSQVTATGFASPTVYIDGSSASAVIDSNWHYVTITTATPFSASAVDIGRVSTGYFDGTLDEVRIYSRAVAATEAVGLTRAGTVLSGGSSTIFQRGTSLGNGLIGLWTFDGPDVLWTASSAGTAYDRSGSNLNGTLTNMSRESSPAIGKLGQGILFDGSNDRVAFSSTDMGTENSAALWIDFQDSGDGVIIGSSTGDYSLYVDQTNVYYSASQGNFVTVAHGGLSSGQWNHLAVSRNGTAVTFYKNGVQLSTSQTLSVNDNLVLTTIGSYSDGTFPTLGRLDDVRIYNRALTAAEAKQLYLLGQLKIKP